MNCQYFIAAWRESLFYLLIWPPESKSNFIASSTPKISWHYKIQLMEENKKWKRIKDEERRRRYTLVEEKSREGEKWARKEVCDNCDKNTLYVIVKS